MNNPHLIFRMTHINNIDLFLSEGQIYAPNYKNQPQFSISYQGINNKRNSSLFTSCNQSIHDFVPFYFSPMNAMHYTLHQNNVNVLDPDQNIINSDSNNIVFLAIKVEALKKLSQQVLISNRACNTYGYETGESLDLIDWGLFNEAPYTSAIPELEYNGVCKFFQDRDSERYAERKTKRMAECLIKDKVLIKNIDAIIVKNKESYDLVSSLVKEYSFKGMVLLKPTCYY